MPLTTIRQKLVEYGFDGYGPYGASTDDVMAFIKNGLGKSILGNEAVIPALTLECPTFVSTKLIPWHKLPENLKIDSLTVDGFPEEFGGCFTQRWSDDVFRESLRNLAFFDDQGKAYLTKALACEVMKTRSACYSPTHDVDCSSETYCQEMDQSLNLKDILNEDDMKALYEEWGAIGPGGVVGGAVTRFPHATGSLSVLQVDEAKKSCKCRSPRRMKRIRRYGNTVYRCVKPKN